ncbi:hypothetical protein [[Pseudomonas] boreopolis]|uniref:hypothetical protein n=1 Tax=Xanthomonas boreopolis TaxID=86183 RepID=UPI003D9BC0E5
MRIAHRLDHPCGIRERNGTTSMGAGAPARRRTKTFKPIPRSIILRPALARGCGLDWSTLATRSSIAGPLDRSTPATSAMCIFGNAIRASPVKDEAAIAVTISPAVLHIRMRHCVDQSLFFRAFFARTAPARASFTPLSRAIRVVPGTSRHASRAHGTTSVADGAMPSANRGTGAIFALDDALPAVPRSRGSRSA